jgi:hypothetical protein
MTMTYLIAYIVAVVNHNRTFILIVGLVFFILLKLFSLFCLQFAWITVILLFLGFYLKFSEIIELSSGTTKDVHNYIVLYSMRLAIGVILSVSILLSLTVYLFDIFHFRF